MRGRASGCSAVGGARATRMAAVASSTRRPRPPSLCLSRQRAPAPRARRAPSARRWRWRAAAQRCSLHRPSGWMTGALSRPLTAGSASSRGARWPRGSRSASTLGRACRCRPSSTANVRAITTAAAAAAATATTSATTSTTTSATPPPPLRHLRYCRAPRGRPFPLSPPT
jgi:hypothetical protein